MVWYNPTTWNKPSQPTNQVGTPTTYSNEPATKGATVLAPSTTPSQAAAAVGQATQNANTQLARVGGSGGGGSTSLPTNKVTITPSSINKETGTTYNPATRSDQSSAVKTLPPITTTTGFNNQPPRYNPTTGIFENAPISTQSSINSYSSQGFNMNNNKLAPWLGERSSIPNVGTKVQGQSDYKTYSQLYNEGYSVSQPVSKPTIKDVAINTGVIAATIVAPEIGIPLAGTFGVYNFGKAAGSIQREELIINPSAPLSSINLAPSVTSKETMINLGMGAISVVPTSGVYGRVLENQIVAGEIAASPKFEVSNMKVVAGEGGQLDFIQATGISKSGLKTTVVAYGKTITTPEGTFFTPSGKGTSTTTGYVRDIMGEGKGTKYFGSSTFEYGVKGQSQQVGDFMYSLSKTTVKPQLQYSAIYPATNPTALLPKGSPGGTGILKVGKETFTGQQLSSTKQLASDQFGNEKYVSVGFKSTGGNLNPTLGKTTVFRNDNLKFSGFEKDFSDAGITSFKASGTKTPLSKTFTSEATSGSPQIQLRTTPITSSSISDVPNIAAKTSQIPISSTKQISTSFYLPDTKQVSSPSSKLFSLSETSTISTSSKLSPSLILFTPRATKDLGVTSISTGQYQIPVTTTKQETIISTTNPRAGPSISPPTSTFNLPVGTPIPPFTLPGFDFGNIGTRTYKGKRKYGYTADYRSILLGIKGKAPSRSSFGGYGEAPRPIVNAKNFVVGKTKIFFNNTDNRIKTNLKSKGMGIVNRFVKAQRRRK